MTTTKTETQQAALYRCTDKQTHEVFYTVKSDSSSEDWYQVRFDHSRLDWSCSCPATKPCKHERAVQEILKIRRTRIAAQMGGDTPEIVAKLQAKEDEKRRRIACRQQEDWSAPDAPVYSEVRQTSSLARRAFSIMR